MVNICSWLSTRKQIILSHFFIKFKMWFERFAQCKRIDYFATLSSEHALPWRPAARNARWGRTRPDQGGKSWLHFIRGRSDTSFPSPLAESLFLDSNSPPWKGLVVPFTPTITSLHWPRWKKVNCTSSVYPRIRESPVRPCLKEIKHYSVGRVSLFATFSPLVALFSPLVASPSKVVPSTKASLSPVANRAAAEISAISVSLAGDNNTGEKKEQSVSGLSPTFMSTRECKHCSLTDTFMF